MTLRNREEAVQAALADQFNTPRYCQLVTRTWFNAPSVGDFDGDKAADAEDGWKREPASAKRFDRNQLVEALENARKNKQKGRASAILKALRALPKR